MSDSSDQNYDTPIGFCDGYVECNIDECGHIERFFHPVVGLMKIQTHLEEKHGISEEEFIQDIEEHRINADDEQSDD